MKSLTRFFKLFSDETRLRILMLLSRRELCVCHIMAVLGVSQPLVSRNLHLLSDGGILGERREGKMVFYSLRKDLSAPARKMLRLIVGELKDDPALKADFGALEDCTEFLQKAETCDMKAFKAFMEEQRKKRRK